MKIMTPEEFLVDQLLKMGFLRYMATHCQHGKLISGECDMCELEYERAQHTEQ